MTFRTVISAIPVVRSMSIFIENLWRDRGKFLELAKWDFREAYLGTYFGLAWALLKPMIYLGVLSLGLGYGLGMRSPIEGFGLNVWLICGLLPWMYISESLSSPVQSIVGHSYLVKKMKFNVSLIPLAKVTSILVTHIMLVVLFLVYLVAIGKRPSLQWLQIPYLMFCTTLLLSALGWLTSAIYVFMRDIGQIISLFTTLAIWLTPVFWSADMLKVLPKGVLSMNPFAYIVEGYRDSLLLDRWIFENPTPSLAFWVETVLALVLSMLVFRRLNNHFADVI
jgi:lipopolysaccharide transport system permease protein